VSRDVTRPDRHSQSDTRRKSVVLALLALSFPPGASSWLQRTFFIGILVSFYSQSSGCMALVHASRASSVTFFLAHTFPGLVATCPRAIPRYVWTSFRIFCGEFIGSISVLVLGCRFILGGRLMIYLLLSLEVLDQSASPQRSRILSMVPGNVLCVHSI